MGDGDGHAQGSADDAVSRVRDEHNRRDERDRGDRRDERDRGEGLDGDCADAGAHSASGSVEETEATEKWWCGHEWDPEWYESKRGTACCVRPTWTEADDDRCWWHTTSEKSLAAVRKAQEQAGDLTDEDEIDETAPPLYREPVAVRRRNATAKVAAGDDATSDGRETASVDPESTAAEGDASAAVDNGGEHTANGDPHVDGDTPADDERRTDGDRRAAVDSPVDGDTRTDSDTPAGGDAAGETDGDERHGPPDPADERGYWTEWAATAFPAAPDRPDDGLVDDWRHPAESLCGAELSGLTFREDFDFTGVWFNDATLSGANLRDAPLAQTDFERADLSGAVLRNADMRCADVRSDLTDAYMTGVRLAGGRLGKSGEMYAALPRANLAGAILDDADLRCANLENANLTGTRWVDADLRRAKLEGAAMDRVSLLEADLGDAAFYGATLSDAVIDENTRFRQPRPPAGRIERTRDWIVRFLRRLPGPDPAPVRLPTTAYDPHHREGSVEGWETAGRVPRRYDPDAPPDYAVAPADAHEEAAESPTLPSPRARARDGGRFDAVVPRGRSGNRDPFARVEPSDGDAVAGLPVEPRPLPDDFALLARPTPAAVVPGSYRRPLPSEVPEPAPVVADADTDGVPARYVSPSFTRRDDESGVTDRADATAPDDDPDPSSEWFPSTVRDYVQTHDGRVPRATRSCFGLDRIPDPVDPSTRGGDACVSTHDDTDRPDLSVVSDADESTASGTTDSRPVSSSDRSTDAPAARWRRGVWTSRTIERLAADNGLTELESAAFLGRKDLRRDHAKRGLDRLLAWGSSLFIRYGEGYGRVVGWGVAVVAAFTLVYPTGGWIAAVGDGDPTRITWSAIADDPSLLWASLYYSTLTFTNLGFGDYRPTNALGQFLTVAETSVGVVLLALLVFVVGRRSAR